MNLKGSHSYFTNETNTNDLNDLLIIVQLLNHKLGFKPLGVNTKAHGSLPLSHLNACFFMEIWMFSVKYITWKMQSYRDIAQELDTSS